METIIDMMDKAGLLIFGIGLILVTVFSIAIYSGKLPKVLRNILVILTVLLVVGLLILLAIAWYFTVEKPTGWRRYN